MVAIAARITVPLFLWQDIPAFPRSDFERLSGSFECFLLAALLALAGLLMMWWDRVRARRAAS